MSRTLPEDQDQDLTLKDQDNDSSSVLKESLRLKYKDKGKIGTHLLGLSNIVRTMIVDCLEGVSKVTKYNERYS